MGRRFPDRSAGLITYAVPHRIKENLNTFRSADRSAVAVRAGSRVMSREARDVVGVARFRSVGIHVPHSGYVEKSPPVRANLLSVGEYGLSVFAFLVFLGGRTKHCHIIEQHMIVRTGMVTVRVPNKCRAIAWTSGASPEAHLRRYQRDGRSVDRGGDEVNCQFSGDLLLANPLWRLRP